MSARAGSRTVLHVDMDAFYASVEQRDDASLRGQPVLVGGPSRRGVVLAASYEARPSGARSAMPMAEALRLCPQARVVPPRHHRYAEVSAEVFAIFARYTPEVEALSVDEAFLDVTRSRSLFGEGEEIARAIRADIRRELGLAASAGVAPSKFVAKVASDLGKPDGLLVVPPEDVAAFLEPLPIERMWGVGTKTAPRLHALGLHTLGDLARAPEGLLTRTLGAWGQRMAALSRGEDAREVEPDRAAKSVGAEETFEHDLHDVAQIEGTLLAHAARVARRLHRAELVARVVTVKIKLSDFSVRSRQQKLPDPVADTVALFRAGRELVQRMHIERGVRLTGLSASSLSPAAAAAPSLFVDRAAVARQRIEGVLSQVAERYQGTTLTRADLLPTNLARTRGVR